MKKTDSLLINSEGFHLDGEGKRELRILFLTQWFTPEPFFKGVEYVRRLRNFGHEVYVLTGFPNYPGGKLYEGYKIRPFQKDRIEGISVLRTALYPSHDNSSVGRIANYFSAHTLKATGMVNNPHILKLTAKWCRFIYRFADKIIVISPGFKTKLVSRNLDPDKIEVIYNCCDERNIYPRERDESLTNRLGLSEKFNIMFTGNMGLAQALDSVLDAAVLLIKHYPKIQFVFIGGGIDTDRLKRRVKGMRLTNTRFLGGVSPSEIGEILMLADVMLVHLKNDPLFEITIPGKIQAYMAAGKPIIVAVKGNAADLVQRARAGISCIPEDPQSIAEAVKKMYSMPQEILEELGKNGLKFYNEKLSLRVGLSKLNDVFESVTGKTHFNRH